MKAGRVQNQHRARGASPTRQRAEGQGAVAAVETRTDATATTPRAHERTCIACRKPGGRDDLVRLIEGPDGAIAVDPRARSGGRGAWVHPTRGCIGAAVKRHAAERALKVPVRPMDEKTVVADVAAGMRRRLESLLGAAKRKGVLAIGFEATSEALERVRVPLLLVATDAGATTRAITDDEDGVEGGAGGVAIRAYGTKNELGAVLGRGEVAIAAVTDMKIAVELTTTMDRLAGVEG